MVYKKILPWALAGALLIGNNLGCAQASLYRLQRELKPVLDISLQESRTEANILLDKFPDEVPGIDDIEKYKVDDARHLLVHVRQIHYVDGLDKDGIKEVQRVQDDIYSALSYLIDNRALAEVYCEANSPDLAEIKNYVYETTRKMIARNIMEKKDAYEIVFKNGVQNACDRLAFEGRLDIRGAERLRENVRASLEPINSKNWAKLIFDDREDAALELISKNKDVRAVVVYGSSHYFGDNINRWNKENPENKFSYLVLTPSSYDD